MHPDDVYMYCSIYLVIKVKNLKFGAPSVISIIILKFERDFTVLGCVQKVWAEWQTADQPIEQIRKLFGDN